MRLLLLICLVFISCSGTGVERPENLIPADKMEDILLDISLMYGMRADTYREDKLNAYFGDAYVFKKHNIDSIQFAESQSYYAKTPKLYLKIYKRVLTRLNHMKDSVDAIDKVVTEKNTDKKTQED